MSEKKKWAEYRKRLSLAESLSDQGHELAKLVLILCPNHFGDSCELLRKARAIVAKVEAKP